MIFRVITHGENPVVNLSSLRKIPYKIIYKLIILINT